MKKNTSIMGQILNQWREARWLARSEIQSTLWKRNKLDNPTKRDGYKIEMEVRNGTGGKELIYAALWKRVDEEKIEIALDVKAEVIKNKTTEEDW